MARSTTRFICRVCGAVQARWMGKCPDCGAWDALEEHRSLAGASKDEHRGSAAPAMLAGGSDPAAAPEALPINAVADTAVDRIPTGMGELDRVLGTTPARGATSSANGPRVIAAPAPAGVVPGSTVLLGGDPGIGKSTLLLQAAHLIARAGRRVLYVTSEESAQQTRLRAVRLGIDAPDLLVLADTNLARILEQVRRAQPSVVVIDSVQMIYKGDLPAAPGSVTQLRACCMELVYLAKATGVAVFLVGHVTKQGQLAGPRLLEHMVDTVLYFEGDRYHSHRIVRGVKNRFGNTLEVGLFEMSETGLREVADGSALLAAEYRPMSGSVVCPVISGSRCLLVELQALTATGFLGGVKRKASGVDPNRLAMLIAVLEKRGGLRLADQDVFVSSVGGMKVVEPAADLALALAIAGAYLNKSLAADPAAAMKGVCALGEIGLGGEVRHVHQIEQRVHEAARLGFTTILAPTTRATAPAGCRLVALRSLDQALEWLT